MLENIIWSPGNGISVRFWSVSWCSNQKPLKDQSLASLQEADLEAKVCEFVLPNGQWDNSKRFEDKLAASVCDRIRACYPPIFDKGNHIFLWSKTTNGRFSSSSAYDVSSDRSIMKDEIFKVIWKWRGPERVRIFHLKSVNQFLVTNFSKS